MSKTKVLINTHVTCVLWVSGSVSNISEVVDWIGGFICPKHDDSQQFTNMSVAPVGNEDEDMIVILNDSADLSMMENIWEALEDNGIAYT